LSVLTRTVRRRPPSSKAPGSRTHLRYIKVRIARYVALFYAEKIDDRECGVTHRVSWAFLHILCSAYGFRCIPKPFTLLIVTPCVWIARSAFSRAPSTSGRTMATTHCHSMMNFSCSVESPHAFFTYALHQPLALTCLPANIAQGAIASPVLPWKYWQFAQA